MRDPTKHTYDELRAAYDHFNRKLFDRKLPPCLITLQRKGRSLGYFHADKFATATGNTRAHEIALNPAHFRARPPADLLSTLVHEMTHLQQQEEGTASRPGYHNHAWAELMRAVGLIPSSTGQPGGKQVGQRMDHYVEPGGRFAVACAEFLRLGSAGTWGDAHGEAAAEKKKPAPTRAKFSCPECGLNAWAKPGARLGCLECRAEMVAAEMAEAA